MNKILLSLLIILSLNTNLHAADGSCASLLGAADSKSELGSYLNELFREGVITEQELILFREGLLRGEQINPIQNPEVDIARYVAAEKITELLERDFDIQSVLETANQILNKNMTDTGDSQLVIENITGKLFRLSVAEPEEFQEFRDFIITYFSQPQSVKNHEVLRRAIEITPPYQMYIYSNLIFPYEYWVTHPELVKTAIEKTPLDSVTLYWSITFSEPHWAKHPELIKLIIERSPANTLATFVQNVMASKYWTAHPELLRLAIEKTRPSQMHFFANYVFSKERWTIHPELLRLAIEKTHPLYLYEYARHVFSKPFWANHPELFRITIEESAHLHDASHASSQEHWKNHPALKAAIEIENQISRMDFLRKELGPYPWEGTEQENLEEYLNKLYGRIDE